MSNSFFTWLYIAWVLCNLLPNPKPFGKWKQKGQRWTHMRHCDSSLCIYFAILVLVSCQEPFWVVSPSYTHCNSAAYLPFLITWFSPQVVISQYHHHSEVAPASVFISLSLIRKQVYLLLFKCVVFTCWIETHWKHKVKYNLHGQCFCLLERAENMVLLDVH